MCKCNKNQPWRSIGHVCKFKESNHPLTPPPQRSVASASTMTRHVDKENTAFLHARFPVRQQKHVNTLGGNSFPKFAGGCCGRFHNLKRSHCPGCSNEPTTSGMPMMDFSFVDASLGALGTLGNSPYTTSQRTARMVTHLLASKGP